MIYAEFKSIYIHASITFDTHSTAACLQNSSLSMRTLNKKDLRTVKTGIYFNYGELKT